MNTYIARPTTESQEKALKAVLDALEVPYEQNDTAILQEDATAWLSHSKANEARLNESIRQAESGQVKSVNLDDLWK